MADFDRASGELHIKVLYVGPPRAGKSTSLQVLAREAAKHGRAMSAPSITDRGLMEHLQLCLGRVFGRYTAYVHVLAAPPGAALETTHRHVVRTCDAIVFVADATPTRAQENQRALTLLEADLRREGRDRRAVPALVVQWNKRDQADPAAADAARTFAAGHPVVEAVATRGEGVIAAFQRACLPAIRHAGDAHGLSTTRVPRPAMVAAPLEEPTPGGGTRLSRLFDRARALFVR